MIILTLNLRHRCSMVKRNILYCPNLYLSFSNLKIIFHLSAVDLHISAIDCMLQFFQIFCYCFSVKSICMFVQLITLNQFFLLTSHAIDLHSCETNCTLKIFEFLAVETPCNRFTQRVQSIACCTILKNSSFAHACS